MSHMGFVRTRRRRRVPAYDQPMVSYDDKVSLEARPVDGPRGGASPESIGSGTRFAPGNQTPWTQPLANSDGASLTSLRPKVQPSRGARYLQSRDKERQSSASAKDSQMINNYLNLADPVWLAQIRQARAQDKRPVFLLHSNIHDLVFDPAHTPSSPDELITVLELLKRAAGFGRQLKLDYSLHNGISQDLPAVEGTIPELLGGPFSKEPPEELWRQVAQVSAYKPFSLVPMGGTIHGEIAPPDTWRDPTLVLRLMDRVLTGDFSVFTEDPQVQSQALSVCLILHDVHQFVSRVGPWPLEQVIQNVGTLRGWAANPNLAAKGHIVILLSSEPGSIHSDLLGHGSEIVSVAVPRPNTQERLAFLTWIGTCSKWLNTANAPRSQPLQNRELISRLAATTGGFTYAELRELARSIGVAGNKDWQRTLARQYSTVVSRASSGLLAVTESDHSRLGMSGYKYVDIVVHQPIKRLKQNQAQDCKGVLFVGPSGTGKTYYMQGLASDMGLPVVEFSPKFLWSGDRGPHFEREVALVWSALTDVAPVVVFIDEIDRLLPDRYLMSRLLQMIDRTRDSNRLLWVAATNRPDLLDSYLLSRFPLVVPFLLPDSDASIDLLRRRLPERMGFEWSADEWDDLKLDAVITDPTTGVVSRLSGRDLEMVVRVALWKAPLVGSGTGASKVKVSPRYLQAALGTVGGGREKEYLWYSLHALLRSTVETNSLCEAASTALPDAVARKVIQGLGGTSTSTSTSPMGQVTYRLDKGAIASELGI